MEIWVPAFGYEGLYSVSSEGRVRSENRVVRHHKGGPKRLSGAILSAHPNVHGYLQLTLCKENIRTNHRVHRLVLSSFTRQNPNLDTMHLDGNRLNNSITNLAWGSRTDNMRMASKHGTTNRGAKNPKCKLTADAVLKIRSDKRKQKEIAEDYGIDQSTVSNIKTRQRWTHI